VDPWGSRKPFGSFWFWVGGQLVGNPDVAEQLIHAFSPLLTVATTTGRRNASTVPGISPLDKLDFIIWLRFGRDEDFDSERWGNKSVDQLRQLDLKHVELIPRGYSPFHDGWEAVLVEDGERELLVWRQRNGEGSNSGEIYLPLGEVSRTVVAAYNWFAPLQGTPENTSPAPVTNPKLVSRSVDPRFRGI
jgi:hypothetical protein